MSLASLRGKVDGAQLLAVVLRAVHAGGAHARRSRREHWAARASSSSASTCRTCAGPALKFIKRFDITYPIVSDGGPLVGHYGVTGYPETFFIDRERLRRAAAHRRARVARRPERGHPQRAEARRARLRVGDVRLAAVAAVLALALAAPALASEQHPTQSELEAELVCPTCHTPLDESDSPVAQQMKAYIRQRIAAGATKSQIIDELVGPPNNLGNGVLGVPQQARLRPARVAAAVRRHRGRRGRRSPRRAWYWSRNRRTTARTAASPSADAGPPLDPELERRVDEELARFDA